MKPDTQLSPLERDAVLQIDTHRWVFSYNTVQPPGVAHCGVINKENDTEIVIILVEETDNQGVSVTDYIENLATLLHAQLALDRFDVPNIHWFEHYPARGYAGATLDRVRMEYQDGKWHTPSWRRITRYAQKATAALAASYEHPPQILATVSADQESKCAS
jgi:hypothetical protein